MRLDYAAQLLARAIPRRGGRAHRLQRGLLQPKIQEATGNTPSAYRRLQQGFAWPAA